MDNDFVISFIFSLPKMALVKTLICQLPHAENMLIEGLILRQSDIEVGIFPYHYSAIYQISINYMYFQTFTHRFLLILNGSNNSHCV